MAVAIVTGAIAGKAYGLNTQTAGARVMISNETVLSNGAERFTNYDFYPNKNGQCGGRVPIHRVKNVEWPITMIFTGQATIKKIKLLLNPFVFPQVGADSCAAIIGPDGTTHWLSSKGFKTDECSPLGLSGTSPLDVHIRTYGPQDEHDRLYSALVSPRWGHWVMAATHMDANDCPFVRNPAKHFGEPAEATRIIVHTLQREHCTIFLNHIPLHNRNKQQGGKAGKAVDIYDNSGVAVQVVVPSTVVYHKKNLDWECR